MKDLLERFAVEIAAFAKGGPNLRQRHLAEAEAAGLDPGQIANLAETWDRVIAERKPAVWRRPVQKAVGAEAVEADVVSLAEQRAERRSGVKFHPSDLAKVRKLPTIEEKDRALEQMADLMKVDPIEYDRQKKEWAALLDTTQVAIDKAVKAKLDERPDDREQSQATKLVAIGMSKDVELWHAPDGAGYATVKVAGHRENYRMDGTAFELWLRDKYGQQYQCKVGDEWMPQVPGAGALRDAIASLEGRARFNQDERKPAIRIGGDYKTIWIDLGGPDWRAVRVTAEGWKVEDGADVAFVRAGTMLPMPEPQRGGSIQLLRPLISVREEEFVLVAAWELQALNPEGPYPIMNIHGEAGDGKTWTCERLVMTVNPNSTPLRPVRGIEDLFIAARNNWTVGFDNLSWLSPAYSDALCCLATGIAVGKRAHYTNDEEHAYAVKRPVLFNGIPVDLTQRSDLASRTIRLRTLPIKERRAEAELKEEFERVWPKVFGALLDGLVGALRDWRGIKVDDPARLIDFERFAEAGCRAMGFAEWEFVEAYAANRIGSMVVAAQAHPVGRTIIAFMEAKPKGFAGQMSMLYDTLERYKPWNFGLRDWPKSPTKLSTDLRRLAKPLAAVGITCDVEVDRRGEGGTQQDVVLRHKERP